MPKSLKTILKLTNKEIRVIISLIDSQQFDGARWTINGVDLTEFKKKLIRKLNA